MDLGKRGKRGKLKPGCRGVKWNENREAAALPLGGCDSRCDQRRLMVARQRPVELAPGTVEVNW